MAFVLSLLVLGFGARTEASAQHLEQARQRYADADIDGALAAFESALTEGGHGPRDLADIHRHRGILHALLGDAQVAEEAFLWTLSLDPRQGTPPELSPDQRAAFDEARRRSRAIEIRVDMESMVVGEDVRVRVDVDGSPVRIRRARVTVRGEQGSEVYSDVISTGSTTLPSSVWSDGGTQLTVEVDALDQYGNSLGNSVGDHSALSPSRAGGGVLGDGETNTADDSGSSILEEPLLWAGVGAAVLIVVATVVILSLDHDHTFNTPQVR